MLFSSLPLLLPVARRRPRHRESKSVPVSQSHSQKKEGKDLKSKFKTPDQTHLSTTILNREMTRTPKGRCSSWCISFVSLYYPKLSQRPVDFLFIKGEALLSGQQEEECLWHPHSLATPEEWASMICLMCSGKIRRFGCSQIRSKSKLHLVQVRWLWASKFLRFSVFTFWFPGRNSINCCCSPSKAL